MSTGKRCIIFAGASAAAVLIAYAVFLRDIPAPTVAPSSSIAPASSIAPSSLTASEVQEKVSETIDGIKSGEISTAKHAATFDNFIRGTFFRISDCLTLCNQEKSLAREYAKQEAALSAKAAVDKSVDAAAEQARDAILEQLPGFVSEQPPKENAAPGEQ